MVIPLDCLSISTALKALSRTLTPLSSRTFLAAPRLLSPQFRVSHWQSSAPLSTSQPLRMQYPHGRPQAFASLTNRILYKPDGSSRSKWEGLQVASTLYLFFLLYQTISTAQDVQEENIRLKDQVLSATRVVRLLRVILKLPSIDVDDPIALCSVVRDVYVALFPGDEDRGKKFFTATEAYVQRHASEMKEFKINFEEKQKIVEISRREVFSSTPVKVKILLAAFYFEALDLKLKIADILDIQDQVADMIIRGIIPVAGILADDSNAKNDIKHNELCSEVIE